MDSLWLAVGSALWLGILTSLSPCPLATNIAAVSYVARQVTRPGSVVLAGALYTLGRTASYLILGAGAVWSMLSVASVSMTLQSLAYRFLGPLLIATGLILLGVIDLPLKGRGVSDSMKRLVDRSGLWGALVLGVVFALSFCPVSAALFFGSLVPLAASQRSPLLLPSIYGVGTGLPVIVCAVLLAGGASWLGNVFDRLSQVELWARRATGVVFMVVGVYESVRVLGGAL